MKMMMMMPIPAMKTTMKTSIIKKIMMVTPDEDPMPEDSKPPWEPKVSRPWSLFASPQSAKAPFNESIEGVGDVISPDFCLTCTFVLRRER